MEMLFFDHPWCLHVCVYDSHDMAALASYPYVHLISVHLLMGAPMCLGTSLMGGFRFLESHDCDESCDPYSLVKTASLRGCATHRGYKNARTPQNFAKLNPVHIPVNRLEML
jgi:hypothetical protein